MKENDSPVAPVQNVVHTPGPWTAGSPQYKRGGPPYKIPINASTGTVANEPVGKKVN